MGENQRTEMLALAAALEQLEKRAREHMAERVAYLIDLARQEALYLANK